MKRRTFLKGMGVTGLSVISPVHLFSMPSELIRRTIPSSQEKIPVIGMGSWLTFDAKGSSSRMANMKKVLQNFYQQGGRVIDSSPMYGSSEEVIGILARELGILDHLWVSTKIWTNGKESGIRQMNTSNRFFGNRVQVNHVHNIRDFKTHYATLKEAKEKGQIKYIGLTHYVNSAHQDLVDLIKKYDLDFVQFNFNIDNPHAEKALIPAAADHGVATIINRPLKAGSLFDMVGKNPLPSWAADYGIKTWAAYFLKFIVSNPDITCAIPATTQVAHVLENMEAGRGYLPSANERKKMFEYFKSIA